MYGNGIKKFGFLAASCGKQELGSEMARGRARHSVVVCTQRCSILASGEVRGLDCLAQIRVEL